MASGIRCPQCASVETGLRLRAPGGGDYWRCAQCSTVWLQPLPSSERLAELFAAPYFTGGTRGGYADYLADEELHARNARDRMDLIESLVPRRGPILDVGCAAGHFLQEAQRRGLQPHGTDLSPWAADRIRRLPGIAFHQALEAVPADLGFVAVTFFQVLEHLRDPFAALRSARARLSPGGVLVLETWDAGSRIARLLGRHWHQVNPPTVLYLFDRASLSRALTAAGFPDIEYRRGRKRVSLGLVTTMFRAHHPRLGWLPDRLVRAARLHRVSVRYGFGDLVTVVARPG